MLFPPSLNFLIFLDLLQAGCDLRCRLLCGLSEVEPLSPLDEEEGDVEGEEGDLFLSFFLEFLSSLFGVRRGELCGDCFLFGGVGDFSGRRCLGAIS